MGSALVVLIWEALDNKEKKWKIDLGEKLHQEIVDFLDTDNEGEIRDFIEGSVITHLKDDK
jgi:predicted house-cleaning noncanonical NTP pyrophosphatase (MazG superfamily)